MAPIKRRRFVDTSEIPTSLESEDQVQLDLKLETDSFSRVEESDIEPAHEAGRNEERETAEVKESELINSDNEETRIKNTKERVVIRPKMKKRVNHRPDSPKGGFNNPTGSISPQNNYNPAAELPDSAGEDEIQNRDSKPRLSINDLTKLGMHDLRDLAGRYGISRDDLAPMKKQELIFVILKAHTEHGGIKIGRASCRERV